ncbi:hypothetical protein [Methylacidimicrobium sp. B4]|uniref:hypothetical protein n=1 Tax=Methylacidimicrobium sp. B4 TaxID=2796139 RepID=UPI001A8F5136|nr:hypothetical protein [Methylacidimicrobium sp. B4]QSR85309.1 hypothetical protein MacB4_03395 [Methylacidimicrobium sp. B4]
MKLGDEERLYLEWAEDFDRISGTGAETVQVKNVAGNITLRSPDVIKAINNAWEHQQRNPQRNIKFRFLTTSGIGVEQGAPFGPGIGGLRFWTESRALEDEGERGRTARTIADFLLDEAKVSLRVQTFLQEASDAEIWKRMIAVVEWDTEAEEVPEIVREIEDRLVLLGKEAFVAPDKSKEVADSLFKTVFETATREKDPFLTRAKLWELFYERTYVSMPAATANMLRGFFEQHWKSAGPLPMAIGGRASWIGRPPPLPARYYRRQAIMDEIAARLSSDPVLVLQGGTGVGKSIAAAGHTALSTSSWGWVDMRGVPAATLADLLDRVVGELAAEEGIKNLVLDNIELPADARALEAPMERIAAIVRERSGHLIVTSAIALPQRLSLALALPESGMMSTPAFSRDEIREFLILRGCPGPPVVDGWAAFIELHTSGHAQLVHARIATLEEQGFPTPEMPSALATPTDVVKAQEEARRLITALDLPTRELAYRLSLTPHALPKGQAIAIANLQSPIPEPGLALDRLVGPWVEVVADGLYRISPVLRNLGVEIQGEAWATQMHWDIAQRFLSFEILSPIDVSTMLFHATASKNWSAVAHLSSGILKADNETWEALARSAGWFVFVGIKSAIRPETDASSLVLLRSLQFRLAAAARDDKGAAAVIASIDEELPATVNDTPQRLARYFFLGQVLLRTEVKLPMTQIVAMSLEYIRLGDELKEVLVAIHKPEFDRTMAGPDGIPDLAGVAGFTLSSHVVDRQSLSSLLLACEPLDPTVVRRLLWFVGGRESTARQTLDRVWLAESQLETPDWIACRRVFEDTYALARRCALLGLAQGAAYAIARLTDENLNDSADALRRADAMMAEIGSSPVQEDGRALILLRKGNASDALAIWRELLPRWTQRDEFDRQQTVSHRLAAVAAARLGHWKEAAGWLRSARLLADSVNAALYCAGLWVDEAFARWKSGDHRGALDCAVEGFEAIDRLPSDAADESTYLLRKRANLTIIWMVRSTAGSPPTRLTEPPPAWCSSLEPVKEAQRTPTPSDAAWLHILEFEFASGLGDSHFRKLEARLKTSPYSLIRYAFNRLRLQHRLRSLMLEDFPEAVGDWTTSLALCRRSFKKDGLGAGDSLAADAIIPEHDPVDAELVLSGMLSAVFALAARGAVTSTMLNQWSLSASRADLSATIDPWLKFVAGLFVDNTINAQTALRDRSLPWPWRAVASVRVAIDRATRPVELLMTHHDWTSLLPKGPAGFIVLADVEHLVVSAWLRLAKRHFLLRAPAVTAASLERACASADRGWSKIGKVLLAACDAVPAEVPAEFRPLRCFKWVGREDRAATFRL